MEDNNFWDELANRLREERSHPFEEGDWASIHRRLRVQGKRRRGWLWPLLFAFLFLGNNLIWFVQYQQTANRRDHATSSALRDTVFLIRERQVHDTLWQITFQKPVAGYSSMVSIPAGSGTSAIRALTASSVRTASNLVSLSSKNIVSTPVTPENPAVALRPWEPEYAIVSLPNRLTTLKSPSYIRLITSTPVPTTRVRRSPAMFIEADAGHAWFLPSDLSNAYTQQFGASLYTMPGNWGAVAGLSRRTAAENLPKMTSPVFSYKPSVLELPVDCENCPTTGQPDRVRLQWTEFQLGLVYKLPSFNTKTDLYLSATGRLRGRLNQYRHFHFDQYGGPPIDVDDRYRQKAGLYWNGCSGRILAIRRLKGPFGLYGALEGQWPAGAVPRLTPPSLGINLGVAWYFLN